MKVVFGTCYFAAAAVGEVPAALRSDVERAASRLPEKTRYNVVSVTRTRDVTFLWYPHLDRSAHPYLAESTRVPAASDRTPACRRHAGTNPVILHRLELFLSQGDPRRPALAETTRREQAAGLFARDHLSKIGRRRYWNELCRRAGLLDSLAPEERDETGGIRREQTAIAAKGPSGPTRWAMARSHIHPAVIDWGSGRGRDTRWLRSCGLDVIEYDPFYRSAPPPEAIDFAPARTILLNYVLNVIESPQERAELIAYLSGRAAPGTRIVVSTRTRVDVDGKAADGGWRQHCDGYLTSRSTFQRGFDRDELAGACQRAGRILEIAELSGGVVCVVSVA